MKTLTILMNFLFIILVILNGIYAFDSNSPDNAEAFFPIFLLTPIFIGIIVILISKFHNVAIIFNYSFLLLFTILSIITLGINYFSYQEFRNNININDLLYLFIFYFSYLTPLILNIKYINKNKLNFLEKVK